MTDSKTASQPDFETALHELETLVQLMESGDLLLETALQEFERGVQLTRLCQDRLKVAEQRVAVLNANGEEQALPPQDNLA